MTGIVVWHCIVSPGDPQGGYVVAGRGLLDCPEDTHVLTLSLMFDLMFPMQLLIRHQSLIKAVRTQMLETASL